MQRFLVSYRCLNAIADGFGDGEVLVDAEFAHEAREIAKSILLKRHAGVVCNVREARKVQAAAHRPNQ